tara:strand:+ start:26 stop:631 length:606 start_codon:yes stop_codon:yes gene_type:complete
MPWFKPPLIARFFFNRYVWNIKNDKDSVYLTFDDGPNSEATNWTLSFLKEHQIKATFFCVGNNILKESQIFEQIIKDGHAIGNHLMNHENGFKTKNKDYISSFEQTKKKVKTNLFRPPYGKIKPSQAKTILKKDKIIMWTWLSYDYNKNIDIQTIIKKAKKIKGGDILVFHDSEKSFERLKLILPQVVMLIKNKKLNFKTL